MALTAYSKYRLYVTRTTSSAEGAPGYVTVNTFSGFGSGSGTGTDLFVGGSASASTSYYSPVSPGYVFDGNSSTSWSSNFGSVPQWVRIDLGSPVVIRNFYLSSTANTSEVPRNFIIQGSNDGSTWHDIHKVTDWITSAVGKSENFRLDLSLSGTSLLDTGGAASKVFVHNFISGALVGTAVPDATTGVWALKPQQSGDVLVTHVGPPGFRPMTDGPISPQAE